MLKRKIWAGDDSDALRERMLLEDFEAETLALGRVTLQPGCGNQPSIHPDEEEIYLFLSGSGLLRLGDESAEVTPGDVVYVPRNTTHQMTCTSEVPLSYLYVANWPKD